MVFNLQRYRVDGIVFCSRHSQLNISLAFHEDILNGFQVTGLQIVLYSFLDIF